VEIGRCGCLSEKKAPIDGRCMLLEKKKGNHKKKVKKKKELILIKGKDRPCGDGTPTEKETLTKKKTGGGVVYEKKPRPK